MTVGIIPNILPCFYHILVISFGLEILEAIWKRCSLRILVCQNLLSTWYSVLTKSLLIWLGNYSAFQPSEALFFNHIIACFPWSLNCSGYSILKSVSYLITRPRSYEIMNGKNLRSKLVHGYRLRNFSRYGQIALQSTYANLILSAVKQGNSPFFILSPTLVKELL